MAAAASAAAQKKQSKANIIAIALIVVIVAAGLMGWRALGASAQEGAQGLVAVVHDGDGGELSLPLSEDATRTITTSLGSNTVVVASGSVYVEDADCANHDCVNQDAIDAPGEQVVCLPHKLWIEVVAEGSAAGTDAGAGASTAEQADAFDAESR